MLSRLPYDPFLFVKPHSIKASNAVSRASAGATSTSSTEHCASHANVDNLLNEDDIPMKPMRLTSARFVFDTSLIRFLTLELCSNLFAIDYLDGRRDVTRGQFAEV